MSGQQLRSSSAEAEFDFPKDDDAFSSPEFKEEGEFPEEHAESSSHAGTAKQSLFEGYKDPSKQFSSHTRSYHQSARFGGFLRAHARSCPCDPVDPCFLLGQPCRRASPGLQPQSEQALVATAALPAAQSAEDVPPGPHHRRRADGRRHRESQAEQES